MSAMEAKCNASHHLQKVKCRRRQICALQGVQGGLLSLERISVMTSLSQVGRIEESTVMLKALLRRWEEGDQIGFRVSDPCRCPFEWKKNMHRFVGYIPLHARFFSSPPDVQNLFKAEDAANTERKHISQMQLSDLPD